MRSRIYLPFLLLPVLYAQTQLGSDIDGEAENDRSGGSVSIDSDGSHVAIGAYYNDGTAADAGHVRIYEYSGGSWSQLGSDIDGEATNDRSGISVSIDSDGSHVAIGGNWNDGSFSNAGHVRVYGSGAIISGSSDHWRMMSSPVAGTVYDDLLDELWIQGMTNGDTESGTANVWTYDGSSWNALSNLNTASQTAGAGFLVMFM